MNLTEQQIQSNLKAYELAMRDGNKHGVELKSDERWWKTDGDAFRIDVCYRVRPTPKLRPWKSIDEVPLEHWFRDKVNGEMSRISSVRHGEKFIVCDGWQTFESLFINCQHSPDGKSNWQPCGVEVSE